MHQYLQSFYLDELSRLPTWRVMILPHLIFFEVFFLDGFFAWGAFGWFREMASLVGLISRVTFRGVGRLSWVLIGFKVLTGDGFESKLRQTVLCDKIYQGATNGQIVLNDDLWSKWTDFLASNRRLSCCRYHLKTYPRLRFGFTLDI